MDELRQYAVSIVTAAIICSIVLSLMRDGVYKDLIRFLCSLILVITVIGPVSNWKIKENFLSFEEVLADKQSRVSDGEKMAQQATAEIISSELQAYILEKAEQMGVSLSVEFTLAENNLPVSARICGEISSEDQAELSHILTEDLGISKENQQWTG